MNVVDRIIDAKTLAVLDHRFFGQLITRMLVRESSSVPTAATDGVNLFYNVFFIKSITDPQLLGVLFHEVLHCALGHLWRMGDRNPVKWNVAADAIINPIVIDAGMELPECAVFPEKLNEKYGINIDKSMNVEHVYNLLPDDVIDDYSFLGGMLDPQGAIDQDTWARAASHAARSAGSLPSSLEELIEDLDRSKVDWRSTLQLLLQKCLIHEDYTWRMPNVRYTGLGLYLPSSYSERAPEISIYVDGSGSCWSPEIFREFGGEITGVLAQCRPQRLYVDYFDTEVKEGKGEEFEPGDDVVFRPTGGGGTSFECIFEHIERTGRNPAAVIVLTDGYPNSDSWAEEPPYPVVWAINSRVVAPFGHTVDIREGA
jgi:predicted metal-dependent peptidase